MKQFFSGARHPNSTSENQVIEMQVFNDLSDTTLRKEAAMVGGATGAHHSSSKTQSDEDSHYQYHQTSLLSSDDQHQNRKARSQDTDRRHIQNNVNKKHYKLENQKIAKDYTQDFLEEYKEDETQDQYHCEPHQDGSKGPQTRLSLLTGKVYESDANNSDSFEKPGSGNNTS